MRLEDGGEFRGEVQEEEDDGDDADEAGDEVEEDDEDERTSSVVTVAPKQTNTLYPFPPPFYSHP